ncbi:hypothetical protein M758_12G069200 [Ceratodon purpureus]|nr:hypothetical protein M758_12G069200 [Ceratodon purpureus]
MRALAELCNLLTESRSVPSAEGIAVLQDQCPAPGFTQRVPVQLTGRQFNGILLLTRYVAGTSERDGISEPFSLVLEFLQGVPSIVKDDSPGGPDDLNSYFEELIKHVGEVAKVYPDVSRDSSKVIASFIQNFIADSVQEGSSLMKQNPSLTRVLFSALARGCPTLIADDAERVALCILKHWNVPVESSWAPISLQELTPNGESLTLYHTPENNGTLNMLHREPSIDDPFEVDTDEGDSFHTLQPTLSKFSPGIVDATGHSDKLNGTSKSGRKLQTIFEAETLDALERHDLAIRLLAQVLERVRDNEPLVLQLRAASIRQLRDVALLLKIRKRDWTVDGVPLLAKMNVKLQTAQLACAVQQRFLKPDMNGNLSKSYSNGKLPKTRIRDTLSLLMDVADASIISPWRRLKTSEALVGYLVAVVAQVGALHGTSMFRILLLRFKALLLSACAQVDMSSTSTLLASIVKSVCVLIGEGWNFDETAIKSFLLSLAVYVRERLAKEKKEKEMAAVTQLNVISLLADVAVSLKKSDAVDLILPLFIESLEEGDASVPSLVRLQVLNALARMACFGCYKSYREIAVQLTRNYVNRLSTLESAYSRLAPELATECEETLPTALLYVSQSLKDPSMRTDYRQRLLILCSDVGLATDSKEGRSGQQLLGPLLPAVAEICSDLDPAEEMEPQQLKLLRSLWFYIAFFGLAPPILKVPMSSKSASLSRSQVTMSRSRQTMNGMYAISGPYLLSPDWSAAVCRLALATPPLVVNSMKWLEDEQELGALHNLNSRRGGNNEKAQVIQRTMLSAALGGQVDVASMSTISGVKATYLLAVVFLETLRMSRQGGILNGKDITGNRRSALNCIFKYLETSSRNPAVDQCLSTIVYRAFGAALTWLEDEQFFSGDDLEIKQRILTAHACCLISHATHREEPVREMADSLLSQLKNKFPPVLWNKQCLEAMLRLLSEQPPLLSGMDSAAVRDIRELTYQRVQEWITYALLYAPSTTQGLIQEYFRQVTASQNVAHSSNIIALLSDTRLDPSASIMGAVPAVTAATAAAAGGDMSRMDVLSVGITSANVKSKYVGEIAGMKRMLSVSMGGLTLGEMQRTLKTGNVKNEEFLHVELIDRFIQQLQQFITDAQLGLSIDKERYRDACLQAAALLLSNTTSTTEVPSKPTYQLLRLLCWSPAHIFSTEVIETGVFAWTWLFAAAPHFSSLVLAEVVDAWLWTVESRRGLFAAGVSNSGPAMQLRPQLSPGQPGPPLAQDPIEAITAHRLWLGFFLDRFEVIKHSGSDQLLLLMRLLEGSVQTHTHFSSHPGAVGTFFTLLLLGLKTCECLVQSGSPNERVGVQLLRDRIYRAAFEWFAVEPTWHESSVEGMAAAEAQAVSTFTQQLALAQPDTNDHTELPGRSPSRSARLASSAFFPHYTPSSVRPSADLHTQMEIDHPVWGKVDNDSKGSQKQLLCMLCQLELDRLDTWAHPLQVCAIPRLQKTVSERLEDYVKTAWSVDPRIALALVARFPGSAALKAEVSMLVQANIQDLTHIPEALPYFVTPEAVEEDSRVLQWLLHWAPCSLTSALAFLTPAYKGHHRVMAYVLRVMEFYPPERVTFFMPQLVQALRYDQGGLVEGYLMVAASRSNLFAHILIWQLQGEEPPSSDDIKEEHAVEGSALYDIVPKLKQLIIRSFTPEAYDIFLREFRFFDKVTSISGILYQLPKEERRAGIRRELEKIEVEGDNLYLPTAPNKLVRSIRMDSGIPLQSAAKVPIMITFNVVDEDGDPDDIKPQACIFKVGDDCRQDVLALQVIALLKDIWKAIGVNLYVFPYGVLPTGYGRGIIEVVPNTRSRSQMGEVTDGGLFEIFQQEYGPVGSTRFEEAREKFVVSSAGYAVASLLLQPKDRHNGNLLFDNEGRLVHIDFGFILETSPGGNMRFENADFKLSHEMTQLLDPSGSMKSETWNYFVSLCVKGYLAARLHMEGILTTVHLMIDSGLPCFSRGDPIGNLRKRLHPEMSEREAATFMIKTCADAYNKWSTAGYDLIQYLQQGIER